MNDLGCRCGDATVHGCAEDAGAPGDPSRFRHSAILGRMLDRIARAEAFGSRPLARLGTRDSADPAIALLSATAGAAHVLGWTLHRLYTDGTLPGTEDRAALVALTGLLGHQPRPAISATTALSFFLDDLPGSPTTVMIPKGTKIASVPAQGQRPQTFESDAEIEARITWNAIRPLRAAAPPEVAADTTEITVHGLDLNARVGDRVLVWAGKDSTSVTWVLARVTGVTVDPSAPPRTVLTLAGQESVAVEADPKDPAARGSVILLGVHARAFGATAPDISFMPDTVRGSDPPADWDNLIMGPTDEKPWPVHLDAIVPAAAPGRAVVFEAAPGQAVVSAATSETAGEKPPRGIGRIASAIETSRTGFGLSAAVTMVGITIAEETAKRFNTRVRRTVIHVETARTTLVVPQADPVLPLTDAGQEAAGQHADLPSANRADRLYVEGVVDLPPGRRVVLTGKADDGEQFVEAATIASTTTAPDADPPATLLVFDAPLAGRWRAAALTIHGNVVAASQGDTPAMGAETLGSGNPATPLPRYALRQTPVAHVPAPGVRGYAPAIEVRVDGRAYEHADTLFDAGPDSRRFQVRTRGDGGSEVQFAGRLPSGTGNVVALYRTGGGAAGNVAEGRLTQMLTPVLGIRSVTNAMRADGGSEPETLEEMRTVAPKAIRTLDRAVSLADYEAFAEGRRGVGKAAAVELRSGRRRTIRVTIATTSLAPPAPGSDIVIGLREAILEAAPPGTRVQVVGFADLPMSLEIALASDPTLRRSEVEAAVAAALERDFRRAARRFGDAVHRSQILAAVQRVPGVVAALLTAFSAPDTAEDAEGRLRCPDPSHLLSVAATAITFTELTP